MLLQFKVLNKLRTKRVTFEDVFIALDSATLEQLKELSAKRRVIEESINETSHITEATAREMHGGLTSRHEQDLQRLEQYLPLLENLIHRVDSMCNKKRVIQWISELKIRWTSTLSSSFFRINGPKFFQIDSLKYELAMTLFLYGVMLRERAFEVLSKDLQQSGSLLTKAAGVYNYLASEILPSLQPILPPDKPPEASVHLSSVMCLICLAEAQAVTIMKAEEIKTSPGLLAKLHYGVSRMLDEASTTMHLVCKDCKDISVDFLEFILSCRALHELKSYKHVAEAFKLDNQLGVAVGLLHHALDGANKKTPSEPSLRVILKNEVDVISGTLRKYENENSFLLRERIPLATELPSPESKKIVRLTAYKPQKWERELAFKM